MRESASSSGSIPVKSDMAVIVAPGSAWVAVLRDVTCLWWDLVPAYAFSYTIPAGHCLRDAPESTGPLFARRETAGYHDEIYLDGFDDSCHATWARKSSF